jgi:haloalkane dehalogenase
VFDDDRIDADAVHARVVPGPFLYFPAWRVYSQEVDELWPSKVVPGWCLGPLDAADLAAYDAPFPTQAFTAGVRRFPMLVPLSGDDPERELNEAAWEVLERWTTKPVLTLWGDHCPHTNMTMGEPYRARIPGASLPGVEHRVYRASHFSQEDVGEEMAADVVRFVRAFPRQG